LGWRYNFVAKQVKEIKMAGNFQCLGFWTPGPLELIIILIVAVLIFGRRLPEIARSIGKSLTEFKKGIHEAEETKDKLEDDVRQLRNEVVNETKDAAGLNDSDNKS
jgi:sec-independent protein translocase protein TatA